MSPPQHALRRWRAAALGALAAVLLAAALPAQTAPVYHFGPPTATVPLAVGPQVLTAEERAFIAGLPEIRVAVPLPPSQPYEVVAADGQISGIHPQMLLSLARAFGLKLRPVVLPDWSSVLAAARKREVDLLMTLGVTTERTEYLAFTLGATPLPGALFARAAAAGREPLPAPSQARFALERSYMTNDVVRRQYPDAAIMTVETTGEALATGRRPG